MIIDWCSCYYYRAHSYDLKFGCAENLFRFMTTPKLDGYVPTRRHGIVSYFNSTNAHIFHWLHQSQQLKHTGSGIYAVCHVWQSIDRLNFECCIPFHFGNVLLRSSSVQTVTLARRQYVAIYYPSAVTARPYVPCTLYANNKIESGIIICSTFAEQQRLLRAETLTRTACIPKHPGGTHIHSTSSIQNFAHKMHTHQCRQTDIRYWN